MENKSIKYITANVDRLRDPFVLVEDNAYYMPTEIFSGSSVSL